MMTNKERLDEVVTDKTMTADGYDDAIIGTVERFGDAETIVLYDKEKVIEILMKDMPQEEAEDFFYFNVLGSYVGEGTPAFATIFNKRVTERRHSHDKDRNR